MISLKLCRTILIRLFIAVVIISTLLVPAGFCQETEDSQIFIAGFNAYQQKDYPSAIAKLNEVLAKYPDTSLRDMALFWLARSYFRNGNQLDAARVMSQVSKEYPDNPLKATVEEDLLNLVARYEKGEKLPAGTPPVKVAEEQAARKAKAEQEHLAIARKEQERIAAEKLKAEQARIAAAKAEQERLAQEKAAKEKAMAQGEQQRLAAAKAEAERKTAEKERLAAAQVEQERMAARKADEERQAAEVARHRQQQERIAAEKAAADAEAARLAAARKEQERLAAAQTEKERQAKQREAEEKARAAKAALREKAIAQYKSIIENYPESTAAGTAVAKLKELGIAVAMPPKGAVEQKPEEQAENAQVLKLQVAQFAGFEFNLLAKPQPYDVARRISVPFEIVNRGNGKDSFNLESGFPAEFKAGFAAASAPDQPISQTPIMAPGESFKGIVTLTIPATSIDGLRITHPVKAVSRFMGEATQSREVTLIAAAPLLRAVLKTDTTQPLPGEKIKYHVAVLNVGSTAARNVTFRLNFPPQFEPLDYSAAGFKQEAQSVLVLDGMQVKSGESREFIVTFRLKDDSLAGQELLCRAELVNNPLKTSAAFISNASFVKPHRGITVRTDASRLVAIPGQTVTIPLVVTNTGNIREKFKIASLVKGAQPATIYHDLNRDGVRQANEPAVTEIGPLEPKEEASLVVEIKTPRNASDGSEGDIQVSLATDREAAHAATVSARLIYSRPVLQMAMVGRDEHPRPGEVASFDLTITNRGSNIARVVELQSVWPEQLDLIAAEPANSSANAGNVLWKFNELGAGEKRTIKVSFRVKAGTGVGTNIHVRNVLSYEDQLGNRY